MPAAGGKNDWSMRAVRNSRGAWDSTVGVPRGLQDTLRSSDSWGAREMGFITFRFCLGPSLLPSSPQALPLLGDGVGKLNPPLRSPPPAPVTAPCVSGWSLGSRRPFMVHSPAAPSPPSLPSNPIPSCPHQSAAAQPLQLAWLGRSQAEQVHSGRWWKNVDKFLICNTLGKGLLPLFEDECINKARRRLQGEADERQKTRNFMAIRSVL